MYSKNINDYFIDSKVERRQIWAARKGNTR